ncbi:MAG: rhomboid family intramembrane serine protease [Sedimentisphaerales bacterium]|nr:rhomboid family intramembrane serine protease [Sedimentisphaerales bacterium]
MGLYDRDYTQEIFQSQYHSSPHMRLQFPSITPIVKWLLIINITVFLAGFLINRIEYLQYEYFSVYPKNVKTSMQLWRYITYQFLHGGLWHIFVNMFVLYFFGTMLEKLWGSKKFLTFYLICGMTGGIFYPVLVHIGWLRVGTLVGASGAILGMLAAAAILFPKMIVYIYGVIPMRMSVFAIIMCIISLLSVLRPGKTENAGGEAAHLGGMCAGVVYVLSEKWRQKVKMKVHKNILQKKVTDQRTLQLEVDRILKKVYDKGMHSLTYKEKRILKQATKAEQMRN